MRERPKAGDTARTTSRMYVPASAVPMMCLSPSTMPALSPSSRPHDLLHPHADAAHIEAGILASATRSGCRHGQSSTLPPSIPVSSRSISSQDLGKEVERLTDGWVSMWYLNAQARLPHGRTCCRCRAVASSACRSIQCRLMCRWPRPRSCGSKTSSAMPTSMSGRSN